MKIIKHPCLTYYTGDPTGDYWYTCAECGAELKRTFRGLLHPIYFLFPFRRKCHHAGKIVQDPDAPETLDASIVSMA
jgi:hypothetical protein